jgi:Gpi18-like mannosyltransferase
MPDWTSAIPIVLFDSGCALMIYKILKNLVSKKSALWGAILFSLSAINIFYIGIYWLNPSPMIFFLLVSFYYLINYRYYNSIICLVTSVMMKQTGLYYVPIFMSFLIKRVKQNEKIIKLLLFFITIGIFFQTPYIFITPINYLRHLFVTPNPTLSTEIPEPIDNFPITLPQFIHYGIKINATISGIFNYLISTYFLFIFFISVITSYIIFSSNKKELQNYDLLFLFTLNGLISYIVQPKGLYKYYLSTLTPFLIMSIIYGVNYMNTNKLKKYFVIIFYLIFNVSTIFIPRIYTHGLVLLALILIIYLYKFSKLKTPLPNEIG